MTGGTPMNASGTISKIVLGVDDAPENLFLLKAAVKAGGYTFLGAKSGLECLAFVRRVTPRSSFSISKCRRWTASRRAAKSARGPSFGVSPSPF
jgi:hypothetical protein